MNRNHQAVFNGKRIVSLSAVLLVSGVLILPSEGQTPVNPVMMSDGNTMAMVDVASAMGMYQWNVGGQNQLNKQWFWYRVGDGQQYSIDTMGVPIVSRPSGNSSLSTIYDNGTFRVTVDYFLKDEGTGQADITESLRIYNETSGSIPIHFFQYSDFNLNGTPDGDEVWASTSDAYQQKDGTGIAEGIVAPDASRYEAATTGGSDSTLNRLTTQSNVSLNDNDYASGDVTWAFEWDISIGTGATVDILKDKQLWVAYVPEPSASALIALGLGAWGVARRRQSC